LLGLCAAAVAATLSVAILAGRLFIG